MAGHGDGAMGSESEWVDGVGLHTGAPVVVRLRRRAGAVTLRTAEAESRIDELAIAPAERATVVSSADGRLCVRTVEHVFAALGGLSIGGGLSLEVSGPEMPLLDGGAGTWCQAVRALGLPASAPRLFVARAATIDCDKSRYEFQPGPRVVVEVEVDFDDPRIAAHAAWAGDATDFCERIAPARTFAFAREIESLVSRGLAQHVDRHAVIVIADDAIFWAGRPFAPDEPARHKLLDLIGDLYIHGGPPVGRVRAFRPGHASSACAIRRARAEGVLLRVS